MLRIVSPYTRVFLFALPLLCLIGIFFGKCDGRTGVIWIHGWIVSYVVMVM